MTQQPMPTSRIPWDQRYGGTEFAYGTAPNDFLRSVVDRLPEGRVLCLAEGEGRNAVFLAERGRYPHAVDASSVGLRKALHFAEQRNVSITTTVADLRTYELGDARWDAIVSIWCHLPSALRARVHASVVRALKPGGIFVLEAYTPRQLELRTGGPSDPDMVMTLSALRRELDGLEFIHAQELDREVHEGSLHNGMSAVVQVLAARPAVSG